MSNIHEQDEEELKTSLRCTDDGKDGYEYFEAKPSTDDSILKLFPSQSETNRDNVQLLFECRYKDCIAASTENTLGYCGKHFPELLREGKLPIPSPDDIRRFHKKRQSYEPFVPRKDDDVITESFDDITLQPSRGCSAPMCHKRSARGARFCADCLQFLESRAALSKWRHQDGGRDDGRKKRLRCPGCQGYGLVTYNGLCGECYRDMCSAHAQQIAVPSPIGDNDVNAQTSSQGGAERRPAFKPRSSRPKSDKRTSNGVRSAAKPKTERGSDWITSRDIAHARTTQSPMMHRHPRYRLLNESRYELRSRSATPPNRTLPSRRRTRSTCCESSEKKRRPHIGNTTANEAQTDSKHQYCMEWLEQGQDAGNDCDLESCDLQKRDLTTYDLESRDLESRDLCTLNLKGPQQQMGACNDFEMVATRSHGGYSGAAAPSQRSGNTSEEFVMVNREHCMPAELSYTPGPNLRICPSEGCRHFGNEACNGYCNACYRSLRK